MADVLVITGGSRGIGAATAKLGAERGYKVVLSYLERGDAADAVVAAITAAGGEALAVQADTAVEADVTKLFDAAQERFGPVTAVVNNAGMNGGPSTVADLDTAELRRLFDINVIGVFLVAREAGAPHGHRPRRGRGAPSSISAPSRRCAAVLASGCITRRRRGR